ncbi:MAG: hypothetical protein IJ561_04730 [Ruminococcus sp.]|nr:hypothetical protein [Ruminococcus sp.]
MTLFRKILARISSAIEGSKNAPLWVRYLRLTVIGIFLAVLFSVGVIAAAEWGGSLGFLAAALALVAIEMVLVRAIRKVRKGE